MTLTSDGIATDDNIFARRTTNLGISSTENAEDMEKAKRDSSHPQAHAFPTRSESSIAGAKAKEKVGLLRSE